MVKHIVMFKLIDNNKANIEKVVAALKTLKGNIDILRSVEIGINFKESERNYDIVLTTAFDNRNQLSVYGTHPKHLPVVELIKSLCVSSIVVDYEIDQS